MTTTTLSDLPAYCLELLAAHEAFGRLGFSMEDVFVGCEGVAGASANVLFVRLKTQGKEFAIALGNMGNTPRETVLSEWSVAIARSRVVPEAELARCYSQSTFGAIENFCRLAGALAKRGFEMPALAALGHDKDAQALAALLWGQSDFVSPVVPS